MSNRIILVGGGGHCISCIDIIETIGDYEIYGILDLAEKMGQKILDYKIIGTDSEIGHYAAKGFSFLVTTGQVKTNVTRKRLFHLILSGNGKIETIKATTAYVSKYAEIGRGTIIMHNAVVNANVRIGNNCIINSNALIEHDAIISDHTHVSTMAVVNGGCSIGESCFIGSNAVVNHGVAIGSEIVIGAGAVVNKAITAVGMYAGNPCQKITGKNE